MNQPELKEYRKLKRAGYNVNTDPTFTFNAGGSGETIQHCFGKLITAYVGLNNGYRADCEVTRETSHGTTHGEIDVLLYAPDRINRAVEIETNISEDIVADKLSRYVADSPVVDELHVIETKSLGSNVFDMRDTICSELGFY